MTESPLRDLARQLRATAQAHFAYSQVVELMQVVDMHINAWRISRRCMRLVTRYEREQTDMSDHEPMLQFFAYEHLRPQLQAISAPFGDLAEWVVENLPRNPERSACLRKLLEAKDCAVRASIYQDAS